VNDRAILFRGAPYLELKFTRNHLIGNWPSEFDWTSASKIHIFRTLNIAAQQAAKKVLVVILRKAQEAFFRGL
jgi:hypothetical protein